MKEKFKIMGYSKKTLKSPSINRKILYSLMSTLEKVKIENK